MAEEEAEKGEGVAVVDFDVLCATVALQTRGFSAEKKRGTEGSGDEEGEAEFGGGVQRMWEGNVLDCFDDRRIAIESTCCPCYRFGKNMRRANLGPCFLQGTIYFVLIIFVLLSFIAFLVTKWRYFLLVGIMSTISFGVYTGYFRTRIRKQFNIRGSGRSGSSGSLIILHDCISHQICPCCTLCQESRTLEMNNVQDGVWHGRGDTICVGSFGEGSKEFSALHKPSLSTPTKSPELCSIERASIGSEHSWNVDINHSEPLVKSAQ